MGVYLGVSALVSGALLPRIGHAIPKFFDAIMRLFHEAGGTWFWWSMEGGAQYVRLYKYAFNYLTATKGLHNMIWLLPYDGSPDASFYPGKSLD